MYLLSQSLNLTQTYELFLVLQVLFSYKHLFKGREETFKIEDYFSHVSEMDLEAGILAPVLYTKVAPLHSYSAIYAHKYSK